MNVDGILNLRAIPHDGNLSFVEFWDAMESSLQLNSTDDGTFKVNFRATFIDRPR